MIYDVDFTVPEMMNEEFEAVVPVIGGGLENSEELEKLTRKVDGEIERAQRAEEENKQAITAEVQRAQRAEGNNKKAIENEAQRAKDAEMALGKRIDNIKIPEVPKVDLSDYYTKKEVDAELKEKQDAIADLETIRSGAEKGATAVQKDELASAVKEEAERAKKAEGELEKKIDEIDIPKAVTEETVSGWGFTKNTGTYTMPADGIPASDLSQEVQDALRSAEECITSTETTEDVENIEENLVANALRKTTQVLTDAEKEIARGNIGAVSYNELNSAIANAITNTLNTAV